MADNWAVGGTFVIAYLVFSVIMQLLEQVLELRQFQRNKETEVPKELKELGVEVNEKEFLDTQAYQKDKRIFGFVKAWVFFFYQVWQLMYVTPALWHYSYSIFHDKGDYWEYKTTLFWLFLGSWVDKPLAIPFALYSTFVIEERHGFNKQTIGLFVGDLAKSELLSYVFGGLIIPLLIWLVQSTGDKFYLYVWGFVQTLIFAFMWIYPNFIQPLFNKFETLQDEELKKKIEELAASHEFPLTNLFQIDGSKRSGHSNAYFFGFWKYKRIVLYDTLLHLKHGDILAILCHELGHWKFNHTTMNLGISSAHIFFIFWLFGQVMYSGDISAEIIRQFGYGDTKAVMVALMIFMMLFEPTEQLMRLLMTVLSRKFEFQADGFAFSNGRSEELQNGLKIIQMENKGDLNPDPWYSWYHFSHPPLVERLRALKDAEASKSKKKEN
jgi:STE24 endopeptidase